MENARRQQKKFKTNLNTEKTFLMDHGSWISSIDHALQHVSGSAFYGLVPKDKHCFFQLILFFRSKSLNSTPPPKKRYVGLWD